MRVAINDPHSLVDLARRTTNEEQPVPPERRALSEAVVVIKSIEGWTTVLEGQDEIVVDSETDVVEMIIGLHALHLLEGTADRMIIVEQERGAVTATS